MTTYTMCWKSWTANRFYSLDNDMIIGRGLIANAFMQSDLADDQNVVVFASGVSNSREVRTEEFMRERKMLLDALALKKHCIYFSTCSVGDPELLNSPYVAHKNEMESLARLSGSNSIFRLPQVVGKTPNPNTLTNYLYTQISSGHAFQIWRHAKRNLIDVDDVVLIVNYLAHTSAAKELTENIASPFSVSILQLVNIFETILGKSANYKSVDAGGAYSIDSEMAKEVASRSGISFDENYIEKVIRKYYGK